MPTYITRLKTRRHSRRNGQVFPQTRIDDPVLAYGIIRLSQWHVHIAETQNDSAGGLRAHKLVSTDSGVADELDLQHVKPGNLGREGHLGDDKTQWNGLVAGENGRVGQSSVD